ncbi:MAG: ABC transporter permease, partial [bacterium]|nr:ABC transporter permease [bacterium]
MKEIINAILNLGRQGQHNVVKILCLAVGLALGSVMIAEVWYEQNYDTWFRGHERTYRVYLSGSVNGQQLEGRFTSGATAMGLRKYCPQVEAATRWRELLDKGQFIAAGDKRIMARCMIADSCLFDVFPQTIIAGDAKKALSQPFYCVVSRDLA